MDIIWADFDSSDPTDVFLLGFGYLWLAVLLGMGIMDFIYQVWIV
jgi:hypothetical protein|tara:strand:+ start:375 stop:509 length:135 start_codon:yes stop_codon:yes gene_type:complete